MSGLKKARTRLINAGVSTLSITGGSYTWAEIIAKVAAEQWLVISGRDGHLHRGLRARPYGVGLDENQAKNYRLIGLSYAHDETAAGVVADVLAFGSATTGSMTGGAGEPIGAGDRWCDTLTVTQTTTATTPKGPGAIQKTGLNIPAPQVYSPEDNTPAQLFLGDAMPYDALIFESQTGLRWAVELFA